MAPSPEGRYHFPSQPLKGIARAASFDGSTVSLLTLDMGLSVAFATKPEQTARIPVDRYTLDSQI